MSDDPVEAAVLAYLERRDSEPLLTPEAFAAAQLESQSAILTGIRAALDLERLLASDSPTERRIGPYRLLGELGRGGMGVVHRAERDGREVAIKILPLAPLMGARMMTRFEREAAALARLSHPNIVRVHDSGVHEGVPYLVMDLIEGRPLSQIAASLGERDSVALLRTLAETVHVAHTQGVLHRDIKPQNILVRADGSPVLLDFGLSVFDEASSLTMTGDVLGTPRYMAPEQLTGGTIDARTDVHALGLILYELVTGQPAHDPGTREAAFDSVRQGRIASPRTHRPQITRSLEAVILTTLARDPAGRYPDAAALAADLARCERGEPTWAKPASAATRIAQSLLSAPARLRSALRTTLSAPPEDRHRAGALIDSAVRAWADGERDAACRQLDQAHRLDRREPTAALLLAHLEGRMLPQGSPEAAALASALRHHEAGEHRLALTELPSADSGDVRASLRSAIAGLSSAHAGDDAQAFEELTTAARLLPGSKRIQRTLALVCQRLGRLDDAVRAHARALELSPDSADGWADLAEVHVKQRAVQEGMHALARAEALASGERPRLLRIHGSLEILTGRPLEAKLLLGRALELDPEDAESRFGLAYALDSDHDMAAAAIAYEHVLEVAPGHVHSLVCLANLHSGASRGQCRRCDEFYAAHPDHFDPRRAEAYLLRAFESDRGADDWATRTARDIALRLEDRASVIALLTRLTQGAARTPAVLRLEEALRRVQFLAG